MDLSELQEIAARERAAQSEIVIRTCVAAGCLSADGEAVKAALDAAVEEHGLGNRVKVVGVGCMGLCGKGPLVAVDPLGDLYQQVTPEQAKTIVAGLAGGEVTAARLDANIPFFSKQVAVVLENSGKVDPERIESYIAADGYQALGMVLRDMSPADVVNAITASGLRGRGGAGYPTGLKWAMVAKSQSERKFVVCNADEGDPGAFMDRSVLESDPHRVLEGMAIAAYAIGASQAFIYVRGEYPLAITRLKRAIQQAKRLGLLGAQVFESALDLRIDLRIGAGAFVCGEETALIASIEGRRGTPRPRPPFPAERGLWGFPTLINNVETFANIPTIIRKGPEWYASIGTEKSKGTKVFALAGKITNTGLIEVPMGTPLRTIVEEMGGGVPGGEVKAVQTGGPSGGCIPASLFDTPVDYESLAQLGSIMGSGGMVVMDEDNCMVDVARYFIEFTHSESCGKCIPCRVGLDKSLHYLNRITQGKGAEADLAILDELSRMIRDTSLCGLGQTAPNPVLTTMRHFRHEFEDHIRAARCRAGVCEDLALSPCENSCPLHMNIPRFLQLLKEDRLEDAFVSVVMDNPLPASTGRVCQHPCDNRCRRSGIDSAVNMREVHRYIADSIYNSPRFPDLVARISSLRLPRTGKRCAVVGAGPTGLACAFYLRMLGHEVMVYDSNPNAGGMLRYALPDYRLPKDVLDREVELIKLMGVDFTFNCPVPASISLNDLDQRYDAVFLAIGTWKENWVYLPGTELTGVIPALPFLEAVSKRETTPLGKRVIVIGGGNAAIDSARTALRLGSDVTVLYRRERKDMPAIPEETEAAEAEGVKIAFLATPHRIVGNSDGRVTAIEAVKTRLGEYDASGRRRPTPTGEIVRFNCDTVILAVGETVDIDFAKASGLKIKENGLIEVDRYTLETSRSKFYAGGDLITGASNVSNAMGIGKKAARNIDKRLTGLKRWRDLFPRFDYDQTPPAHPSDAPRHSVTELEPQDRARSFSEATIGLTTVEAMEESCRCLRCDVRNGDH